MTQSSPTPKNNKTSSKSQKRITNKKKALDAPMSQRSTRLNEDTQDSFPPHSDQSQLTPKVESTGSTLGKQEPEPQSAPQGKFVSSGLGAKKPNQNHDFSKPLEPSKMSDALKSLTSQSSYKGPKQTEDNPFSRPLDRTNIEDIADEQKAEEQQNNDLTQRASTQSFSSSQMYHQNSQKSRHKNADVTKVEDQSICHFESQEDKQIKDNGLNSRPMCHDRSPESRSDLGTMNDSNSHKDQSSYPDFTSQMPNQQRNKTQNDAQQEQKQQSHESQGTSGGGTYNKPLTQQEKINQLNSISRMDDQIDKFMNDQSPDDIIFLHRDYNGIFVEDRNNPNSSTMIPHSDKRAYYILSHILNNEYNIHIESFKNGNKFMDQNCKKLSRDIANRAETRKGIKEQVHQIVDNYISSQLTYGNQSFSLQDVVRLLCSIQSRLTDMSSQQYLPQRQETIPSRSSGNPPPPNHDTYGNSQSATSTTYKGLGQDIEDMGA